MINALVLNDTSPSGHPGCALVMSQLFAGCQAAGIKIKQAIPLGRKFEKEWRSSVPKSDVVIINGEGTIHHDTPGALALAKAGAFACQQGIPVALINTVWQDNRHANQLLGCATLIAARESYSAAEILRNGKKAIVVPDLTLSCPSSQLFSASLPATGSIIVTDDVRADITMLLSRYARSRGLKFYPMVSVSFLRNPHEWLLRAQLGIAAKWAPPLRRDSLSIFAEAGVVVTGRFHGVCFAILARRPFVAFASNTHKIEGLLADAGLGEGGLLVPDPGHSPYTTIDLAVMQVQEATGSTAHMVAYQDACRAYTELASMKATAMFQAVASLAPEMAA